MTENQIMLEKYFFRYAMSQNMRSLTLHKKVLNVTQRFYVFEASRKHTNHK